LLLELLLSVPHRLADSFSHLVPRQPGQLSVIRKLNRKRRAAI